MIQSDRIFRQRKKGKMFLIDYVFEKISQLVYILMVYIFMVIIAFCLLYDPNQNSRYNGIRNRLKEKSDLKIPKSLSPRPSSVAATGVNRRSSTNLNLQSADKTKTEVAATNMYYPSRDINRSNSDVGNNSVRDSGEDVFNIAAQTRAKGGLMDVHSIDRFLSPPKYVPFNRRKFDIKSGFDDEHIQQPPVWNRMQGYLMMKNDDSNNPDPNDVCWETFWAEFDDSCLLMYKEKPSTFSIKSTTLLKLINLKHAKLEIDNSLSFTIYSNTNKDNLLEKNRNQFRVVTENEKDQWINALAKCVQVHLTTLM